MDAGEALFLAIGMALVTFAVRYPLLAFTGRVSLPARVVRALRFVPVAVLSALVAPAMFMPAGAPDISLTNAYLVSGLVTVAIAWWKKNLLLTIVLGMAVFFAWRLLVGGG
ncbi:MAG: hypothetical protein Kow00120_30170 [Anaerolineae bacterium]